MAYQVPDLFFSFCDYSNHSNDKCNLLDLYFKSEVNL